MSDGNKCQFAYPVEWNALRHPNKRHELLSILDSISTMKNCHPSHIDPHEIDYIVHFLFDDSALASNPISEIEHTLFDNSEAESISTLCAILDKMINDIGDRPTCDYLGHPEWEKLESISQSVKADFAKWGNPIGIQTNEEKT